MNNIDTIAMTDDQRRVLRKCIMHTSLAYICSDVAHSNLMLAEQYLDKLDKMIPRGEIIQMMSVKNAIKIALKEVSNMSKPMYDCDSADILCDDSDWLHEIIKEVVQRSNNNEYAKNDILEYIKKYNRKIKTVEKKK